MKLVVVDENTPTINPEEIAYELFCQLVHLEKFELNYVEHFEIEELDEPNWTSAKVCYSVITKLLAPHMTGSERMEDAAETAIFNAWAQRAADVARDDLDQKEAFDKSMEEFYAEIEGWSVLDR